jgi:uncharacterized protein (DUF1697 family)
MTELKKMFEEIGFTDVITYIQTGNVVFTDAEKNTTKLMGKIEYKLFEKLKTKIDMVILTVSEMKEVINKKPKNFGEDNENYKYNVIFLLEPLTADEAIKEFEPREGVDTLYTGEKVLYFMYLIEKRTKSRISKIVESKIYSKLTIRNWNTTEKLHELIKG